MLIVYRISCGTLYAVGLVRVTHTKKPRRGLDIFILTYRSYAVDRSPVFYAGYIMFILVMLNAFIGGLFPWGQMSF